MRKIFVSVLTLKPNEIRVPVHPLAWLKVSVGMEVHARERRRAAVRSPLGPGLPSLPAKLPWEGLEDQAFGWGLGAWPEVGATRHHMTNKVPC